MENKSSPFPLKERKEGRNEEGRKEGGRDRGREGREDRKEKKNANLKTGEKNIPSLTRGQQV